MIGGAGSGRGNIGRCGRTWSGVGSTCARSMAYNERMIATKDQC